MKKLKKPLSIVLAIMLLIGLLPMQVFAEVPDGTQANPVKMYMEVVDTPNYATGTNFTVDVYISGLSGAKIGGLSFVLDYDPAKIEYVSHQIIDGVFPAADMYPSMNTPAGSGVNQGSELSYNFSAQNFNEGTAVTAKTKLVTLTFKVLETAEGVDIAPKFITDPNAQGTLELIEDTAFTPLSLVANAEDQANIITPRMVADQPVITTQPQSRSYKIGATVAELSVVATLPNGNGVLSYQWYSATTANGVGTAIDGATLASYTPTISTASVGEMWYYCVVTNTDVGAITDTETNTTNRAHIQISEKDTPVLTRNPTIEQATYGETLADVVITQDGAAGFAGSLVPGTFAWKTTSTAVGNAGSNTHVMTFTPTDTATYATVDFNILVAVSPKFIAEVDLAISVADQTYTGVQLTPEPTVTIPGATAGERITLVKGTDYTVSHGANINVATGGTVTIDPLAGSNYNFTAKDQNFAINKSGAQVTLTVGNDVTYDGSAVEASDLNLSDDSQSTGSKSYLFYSDASASNNISAPSQVGTYYIVAAVDGDDNHLNVQSAPVAFKINPATYTYTYDGPTNGYIGEPMPTKDDTVSAWGVSIQTDINPGESMPDFVDGTLVWYTDAGYTTPASGNFTEAGSKTLYYEFTPDSTETNYVSTTQKGTQVFNVVSRPPQDLQWTTGDGSEITTTYGGTATGHVATNNDYAVGNVDPNNGRPVVYSSSNSNIVAVDASTGALTIKAAGDVTITAQADAVIGYWAETKLSYKVTVNQKPVNVSIDDQTMEYGDALPTFTVSVDPTTPIVVGDTLDIIYSSTGSPTSNVGNNYTISGTDNDDNYAITFTANGTLDIQKAQIAEKSYYSNSIYSNSEPDDVDLTPMLPSGYGSITTLTIKEQSDTSNVIASITPNPSNMGFSYKLTEGLTEAAIDETAIIVATVETQNYQTFDIVITVNIVDKMQQALYLDKVSVEVKEGDADFTNAVKNAMTAVTYTSSIEEVATVDANGKVTIVGPGTTTITATAEDNNMFKEGIAAYIVTVEAKPAETPDKITFIRMIFDIIFDQIGEFILNNHKLTLTLDGPDKLIISDYPGYDGEVGTIERGSAIVTLNEAFLKAVPQGTTMQLSINDARGDSLVFTTVSTPIEAPAPTPVPPVPDTDVPSTGDTSQPLLFVGLAVISVIGLAVLVVIVKRKKTSENK